MSKKKILVIDDVEITLYAIEQNIESDDRETYLFQNPKEAEAKIDEMGGADFLITDLKMEGSDIEETIKRLKKKYSDIKIVVITGNNSFTEEQAKALGADHLFLKPIDWQALNQFISPPDVPEGALNMLNQQLTAFSDNYILQIIEGMDIGISIVDAERNVIYVNEKQKVISGSPMIGAPCYLSFSQGAHRFCEECPITSKIAATHARPGGFYDIQCIPLINEGKKIGYAKLSNEVTDRERLLSLYGQEPLKGRIEKILEGIKARGFSRVRIYMISEGEKYLIGYYSVGQDENDFIGKSVPIELDKYAKKTFKGKVPLIHVRGEGYEEADDVWLQYFPHKKHLNEWGAIPILMDGTPLGLVTLDNYDEKYPDIKHERIRPIDIAILKEGDKSFSSLIAGAIDADLTRRKTEIDKVLLESDLEIYSQQTLQGMLQVLIEKVIMIIQTYWGYVFEGDANFEVTGHIMKINGKWLEKIAGEGILYEKGLQRANRYRPKDQKLPCVRVFNTDRRFIVDNINEDNDWNELLSDFENSESFNRDAITYMKKLHSFCCIPIKLGDETVGTMSIQSPKPYLFNEYIVEIISGYVSKCSPALKSLHLLEVEKHLVESMSGLAKVIDYLLRNSDNENKLIGTMLAGLTHNKGLGYNRAVYFDCSDNNQFTANNAVGPLNNDEADSLYRAFDIEPPPFDIAVNNAICNNSPLANHVRGKSIDSSHFNEVPQVIELGTVAGDFMPLAREAITISLSYEGKEYGGLLMDNFVTGVKPTERDIHIFKIAAGIFSLIMQNMRAIESTKKADKAKSTFLQNMSHEIRTPLNSIIGFSQLMRRDLSISSEQKERLDTINLSGEHLLSLIEDILEISKIEAGKAILLNPTTFDLHTLLYSMKSVLKVGTDSKTLNLSIKISDEVPHYVVGDEHMLRRVLFNLIGNAIKFTEQGGIVLRANTREEDDNIKLFVEVSDTGPGMTEEEISQLFFLFGQTQIGRRAGTGTGLGLVISRELVRRMGGDITVNSEKGKGSTFKFDIMLKIADSATVERKSEYRNVIGLKSNQPVYRVLVVDDLEDNRALLAQMLKPIGFQISEAANGEEAISIFEKWKPQLILMDLRMPVMDGQTAIKRIREQTGGNEVKIFAVTASVSKDSHEDILTNGADNFISKPFRESELFEKIKKHIGVEYEYEMKADKYVSTDSSLMDINNDTIKQLPSDLVERIRMAAISGRRARLFELIIEVNQQLPQLAVRLTDLVRRRQYDLLHKLFTEGV